MATPNRVLFTAATPATGVEVWVTDGTTGGTSLVKDVTPGAGYGSFTSSTPVFGANLGNLELFIAREPTDGAEIWVTDGTTAGTTLLKNINPGAASGVTSASAAKNSFFIPVGTGKLLFVADDGTGVKPGTGVKLWITDGTSAGTTVLKDVHQGQQGTNPQYFATFGTKALFQGFDGATLGSYAVPGAHGQALWITDGTAAGTTVIEGTANSGPRLITDLGTGRAVFSAAAGSAGLELWATDGTAAGTSVIKDIRPGFYQSSRPSQAILVGTTGKAVFAAIGASVHAGTGNRTTMGTELWVTDGTSAGTSLLKTFSEGYSDSGSFAFLTYGSSSPQSFTQLGGKVVFAGSDAGITGLWATDGTVSGTVKLTGTTDFRSGFPYNFTQFGNKDLFWAGTGLGATPWVTDGTAAGTFQLKQFGNLAAPGIGAGFGVAGSRALFAGLNAITHVQDLWVTDGTVAGTNDTGVAVTSPAGFTTFGNKVVFSATDTVHGNELWISDGLFNTTLLKDINTTGGTPNGSSYPAMFLAAALACFAAGTRILTPEGETPVEALREGDLVITGSGEHREVVWAGHRRVDIARHPDPASVSPVRIAPHAFGANLPHTALLLSPDHAIFIDDVLIPVKCLINGDTIAQMAADTVTYYHIELASHDILLAGGLPVESYLDTGDRANFANGGDVVRLSPDFSGGILPALHWEASGCAPLLVTGPAVEAVRGLLDRRRQNEVKDQSIIDRPHRQLCDRRAAAPVINRDFPSLSAQA